MAGDKRVLRRANLHRKRDVWERDRARALSRSNVFWHAVSRNGSFSRLRDKRQLTQKSRGSSKIGGTASSLLLAL